MSYGRMIDKTAASFSSVDTVNPLSCLGLFLLETVFACGNDILWSSLRGSCTYIYNGKKECNKFSNNARTHKPEKL